MVIHLITRTFNSVEEKDDFEQFFVSKWTKLIKKVSGCTLKLFTDNKKALNFNAVWEFDNKIKQEEVMNLIKKHNNDFEGVIPVKLVNTDGNITNILKR